MDHIGIDLAKCGKVQQTASISAVNRRVAGSSPARGAKSFKINTLRAPFFDRRR